MICSFRDELDTPGILWDDVLSLGEQQRLQFCRTGLPVSYGWRESQALSYRHKRSEKPDWNKEHQVSVSCLYRDTVYVRYLCRQFRYAQIATQEIIMNEWQPSCIMSHCQQLRLVDHRHPTVIVTVICITSASAQSSWTASRWTSSASVSSQCERDWHLPQIPLDKFLMTHNLNFDIFSPLRKCV